MLYYTYNRKNQNSLGSWLGAVLVKTWTPGLSPELSLYYRPLQLILAGGTTLNPKPTGKQEAPLLRVTMHRYGSFRKLGVPWGSFNGIL